ncbi:hypothetical protein SLEP1_g18923 [Rubroshorea leprosula]|uniref:Uncharacterized protein n=1 Tax=Rubroshorea leprosula TaxID=152421 RepID=A0AAV5J501_9ROSI|nr:hypothetical protein SLEP1_g18923 [Rubroshorea leprosula]
MLMCCGYVFWHAHSTLVHVFMLNFSLLIGCNGQVAVNVHNSFADA